MFKRIRDAFQERFDLRHMIDLALKIFSLESFAAGELTCRPPQEIENQKKERER